RGRGSFLTDGIKVGDVVRLTAGTFDPANLDKNLLVVSLTATVLTVLVLNGSALEAEGPISSATLSLPGKASRVPTSGHTNDYWTVEECYTDLGKYEQFIDCKIASGDVTMPATGNVTVSFDVPGLQRTRGDAAAIASPDAESTSEVL